jgi:putative membrane protein
MRIYRAQFLVLATTMIASCDRADRAAVDTAAGSVAGRIDSAVTATRREYTDAELLGLLNRFNEAEVELGNVAATKASDADVQSFARRTSTDYKALTADIDALARKLSLAPTLPRNDEGIPDAHRRAMSDLNAKPKGKEFDEAYLERQIAIHRKILDEVNDALGRSQNADLRVLLEKAHAQLLANVTAAEELEKRFGV